MLLATVLSPLLFVGIFPLVVRGHWFADCVGYAPAPRGWGCGAYTGVGGVCLWYDPAGHFDDWRGHFAYWSDSSTHDAISQLWRSTRVLGVRVSKHPSKNEWDVYVPYGWCAALAAILPIRWLIRRRRARRPVAGTRAACGFDLRATPGRCPECGAIGRSSPEESPACSSSAN